MSKNEWSKLYHYYSAKKYSRWKPSANLVSGKRSVKNKASGVGQVLRDSKVSYQLPLSEV